MNKPRLLDYLRLFRAPNVFTAMADVMAGFLVTHGGFQPVPRLLCLVAASSLLYVAGMVLNDVFDVEVDRQERPARPLPSGRIAVSWARWLGFDLLILGVILGALSGVIVNTNSNTTRPGLVASVLGACVLLYDGWAKKTLMGPFVMGTCRLLNWLLGMSLDFGSGITPGHELAQSWLTMYAPWQLLIALGIGLYISGVTWFARNEATDSPRSSLAIGVFLMAVGIGVLASHPFLASSPVAAPFTDPFLWPLLLMVLLAPTIRRCFVAFSGPSPGRVQAGVRSAIFSLVVLDAAVAYLYTGGYSALCIALLMIPMTFLGRWIYST